MFRVDDIRVRVPMTVRATSGLGEVRITCRQIVVGLFSRGQMRRASDVVAAARVPRKVNVKGRPIILLERAQLEGYC